MLDTLIGGGIKLLGGLFGQNSQEKQAEKNIQLQREFAQNGIQWKAEDARKAGIHPLYAMGAQTTSFSPVSVGSPLSESLSSIGQDVSRAMDATRSTPARAAALTKTMQDLQLTNMGLQNDLLSAQIAKIRQAGNPPALPAPGDPYLIEGQGQTAGVQDKPLTRVSPNPDAPHQEPGAVSETGYLRTPTGLAPVYSNDAKDRLEEDTIGSLLWNLRNRIAPSLGVNLHPPSTKPPEGYDSWKWNALKAEWQPYKKPDYGSNGMYNRDYLKY